MRSDGIINAAIRHPATIEKLKKPVPGRRLTYEPVKYTGFDIETDPNTGENRLMYDSDGNRIFDAHHTNQERYERLATWLYHQSRMEHNIASWTQFDHIATFRAILDAGTDEEVEKGCLRFGRLNPAITNKQLEFHTFNNVQNIKVKDKDGKKKSVMVIDAKRFFNLDLETTCKELGFKWYSKMEEEGKLSVHVVQWGKYLDPKHHRYRHRVRKSCALDARAAKAIIETAQNNFKDLFGYYPQLLSSTGGLAKAATASILTMKQYQSLYFQDLLDHWRETETRPGTTDRLWCMTHEAFSAGFIEAFRIGYHPKAWVADIASAYPAQIARLCDLRDSTISSGRGAPPKRAMPKDGGPIEDYVLIRGVANIPQGLDHTIGFKNALGNRMTPWGRFDATYNQHERSWVVANGGSFEDEQWIRIRTTGEPHPLSLVSSRFQGQRAQVRQEMGGKWSSRENIPKIADNSLYGICYEHVNEYHDDGAGGTFSHHTTGELYNPLLAGYITSLARLTLVMAITAIKRNGGLPILAMTDSVHWTGRPDMLDPYLKGHGLQSGVKKEKTLGYFEEPKRIHDFYCFGTGRYEYWEGKQHITSSGLTGNKDYDEDMDDLKVKARSYFLKRRDGRPQYFHEAIQREVGYEEPKPHMYHSEKVTPGLVRSQKHLNAKKLNWIHEVKKNIEPLNLGLKRSLDPWVLEDDPRKVYRKILKESIPTHQIKAPDYPQEYVDRLDNTMKKYRDIFYKKNGGKKK